MRRIAISGQEVSRPSAGQLCGSVYPSAVLRVASAGGSAINARFAPSSAVRARSGCSASPSAGKRSAAYLRLPAVEFCGGASVCGLRSAAFPKEAPSMPVLCPPAASVKRLRPSDALHALSRAEVSRLPASTCIRLRSNPAAVWVLYGWRIRENSCFPHFQTKSVKPLDGSLQRRDIMPP